MQLANSSIKVSKKDDFVCVLDSTKYPVDLVIEIAYFFWAVVGHSCGISNDQSTIYTIDKWKAQRDKSVT